MRYAHPAFLGPKGTFDLTWQSHKHEDNLNSPWSPSQVEDTIWKGDASFPSFIDSCAVGIYEGFEHDDKGLFPYTTRDFTSQDIETSFEGNQDETYQRVDTTKKPIHSQDAMHLQALSMLIPCTLKHFRLQITESLAR